jgi:hypothetical protein
MSQFPTFARWLEAVGRPATWRRLAKESAVAVIAISLVGIASNVVSRSSCEADTRSAVRNEFGPGSALAQLTWLPASQVRNEASQFEGGFVPGSFSQRAREFFRYRVYFPNPPRKGVWAFTRPHVLDCPFVVRVYYGHGGHSGCGASAVRDYVCFFGLRALVSDHFYFVT